jgi:hypothetical protein
VELAFQEEKAKSNASSSTSVDDIIGQMSTINDTINEIDGLGIGQPK